MNVLVLFFFLSFLFVESPLAHEDRKSLIRDVGFFSFSLFDLQPEKFAHNLVLYVQGLGKLSALPVSGSWNSRSRTTSQSEYRLHPYNYVSNVLSLISDFCLLFAFVFARK